MIKKDVVFKSTRVEKDSFNKIKDMIVETPTLRRIEFNKYLILYTFSSNLSLAYFLIEVDFLAQENDEGDEVPISFMRMILQGVELNYVHINKGAY